MSPREGCLQAGGDEVNIEGRKNTLTEGDYGITNKRTVDFAAGRAAFSEKNIKTALYCNIKMM
jgi:hypothetical protein